MANLNLRKTNSNQENLVGNSRSKFQQGSDEKKMGTDKENRINEENIKYRVYCKRAWSFLVLNMRKKLSLVLILFEYI